MAVLYALAGCVPWLLRNRNRAVIYGGQQHWWAAKTMQLACLAQDHRADAHHLNAVVMIENRRPTPASKKEVDAALNAGLIRCAYSPTTTPAANKCFKLAAELGAAPINTSASCWCCGADAEGQRRPHGPHAM
jgi:hypothetical protein